VLNYRDPHHHRRASEHKTTAIYATSFARSTNPSRPFPTAKKIKENKKKFISQNNKTTKIQQELKILILFRATELKNI
jgi:hypothetical protein